MKAVLFIGHHKVGSTALQTFFSKNSYRFLKAGVLYPAVDMEGLGYLLKKLAEGRDFDETPPINTREPHNALAFRMIARLPGHKMPDFHPNLPAVPQMRLALQHQIVNLRPHTVVLCSEVMSNFGPVDPAMIDELRDMLLPDDLVVYCALRRPDAYITSWHGQRLKFGHKIAPLRDGAAEGYFHTIHFDYRALVQPWADRIGNGRLILRSYDDILAAGGSAQDFCTAAGIAQPRGLLPVPRANLSIPHALVEIVRLGNHALEPRDAWALRDFIQRHARRLDLPKNGTIEMLGAENRARLLAAFAPIEAYLREVTGRPRFFADLNRAAETALVPERAANAEALAQLRTRLRPEIRAEMPEAVAAFLDNLQV